MLYPFLITSDQHAHDWSAFAETLPTGVNSRLQAILNEMCRAHDVLEDRGGRLSFYAGDLFHVRGSIKPTVFNPTYRTIEAIHSSNPELQTVAIPGNHDLEGKNAEELGNAMQALEQIEGFSVSVKPTLVGDVLVVPWFQDLNELRAILKEWAALVSKPRDQIDVIIHAPVNGIIRGIPDHGLEASELAAYGFRRVFTGHYHDHKVMEGGKVISVGATTHQTWGDPGTTAGFLLVYEDRIEHFPTQAPLFVDLHATEISSGAELKASVSGNYVRYKIESATEEEKKALDAELRSYGARGVNIITEGKKVVTRTGTTVSTSKTLEASVGDFIANVQKPKHLVETQNLCADLLSRARSMA